MSEVSQIPELRFKEFNDRWILNRLIDVADIITGTTPSTFKFEYYEKGQFHFVSPGDINENRYIYETKTMLTELGLTKTRKISKGSVLFVCIGSTIGKVAQTTQECASNQQINALEANSKNSNDFIFSMLEKQGDRIKLLAGNQAVPQINKSEFSVFKFHFPSFQEQQKIASFLTTVDIKIAQLQQKKIHLEQYKKGVMQKVFSQELRFKDDNGTDYPDWEENSLEEVGQIITGKTPSTANKKLWNGNIQFVTPTDINEENKYQFKTQRTVFDTGKLKILPKKSIIYTCIASIGKMSLSIEPCITNQQINSLVPNDNFDNEYVYYALLKITPRIKSVQANTTLPIINKTDFSKFEIPVPCLKEQTKIANFLSAIDDKIQLVHTQLEQIQQFKKGLLQQMFV